MPVRRTFINFITLGASLALSLPIVAQNVHVAALPTLADWRADLDGIVAAIRLNHPNPFGRVGETTFRRAADSLRMALPSLTDAERAVRMMALVARVGDGHTNLQPSAERFRRWYPVRILEYTDGYFITSAHKSVRQLAGARVTEVGGHPIAEVAAAARSLLGADNAMDAAERLYAIHNATLMQGLGYAEADGSLRVTVVLRDGKTVVQRLAAYPADDPQFGADLELFEWTFRREMWGTPIGTAADWTAAFRDTPATAFMQPDSSRPLHLRVRAPYFGIPLPEKKSYYLQLNQFDDNQMIGYMKGAGRAIARLHPERLIVDMRYNFGGDASRLPETLRSLRGSSDSLPWNDLYVLTGRKTFSAAVLGLAAILDQFQVTVIGEPPGAALNSYGDAAAQTFSRTGVTLYVSTVHHQKSVSTDLNPYVPVDVPALTSFADYLAGRDAAVDPILAGAEMRSVAVIAERAGGAAAKRAWDARKSAYASIPWFSPPGEFPLRLVCMRQQEANNLTEALATCALNAEINPFVWNSWYNLGNVQRKSGMREEAMRSYERVLEIDPENFNGAMIRQMLGAGRRP